MPGSIRLINVNGLSAIVDINTTGTPTEFTAYSDLACTQTVALPATITTDTTFYVKATGVVMLSVTVDGTELAGPARVTLSNAGPTTFSLDTDPSNDKSGTLLGLVSTHSSGGSSAVDRLYVQISHSANPPNPGCFVEVAQATDSARALRGLILPTTAFAASGNVEIDVDATSCVHNLLVDIRVLVTSADGTVWISRNTSAPVAVAAGATATPDLATASGSGGSGLSYNGTSHSIDIANAGVYSVAVEVGAIAAA